ncbi:UNVERIFIED_CONTAM: hypothetical protein FKN15_032115 [Acipenser sinensis]
MPAKKKGGERHVIPPPGPCSDGPCIGALGALVPQSLRVSALQNLGAQTCSASVPSAPSVLKHSLNWCPRCFGTLDVPESLCFGTLGTQKLPASVPRCFGTLGA